MKKITEKDIHDLVNRTKTRLMLEKLNAVMGKEVVLSSGLKVKNVESKLEYTIKQVRNVDGVLQVDLVRYDENQNPISLTITQDEFDQYERA